MPLRLHVCGRSAAGAVKVEGAAEVGLGNSEAGCRADDSNAGERVGDESPGERSGERSSVGAAAVGDKGCTGVLGRDEAGARGDTTRNDASGAGWTGKSREALIGVDDRVGLCPKRRGGCSM